MSFRQPVRKVLRLIACHIFLLNEPEPKLYNEKLRNITLNFVFYSSVRLYMCRRMEHWGFNM